MCHFLLSQESGDIVYGTKHGIQTAAGAGI